MRKYVLFISLVFIVSFGWSQGLRTQGTQIVNSNDEEVLFFSAKKENGIACWSGFSLTLIMLHT